MYNLNPCPRCNSFLSCRIWIVLQTIVTHCRLYYNLNPRLYLQGQFQCTHSKALMRQNSLLSGWILIVFYTILSIVRGVSRASSKVILPRGKSQCIDSYKLCPSHTSLPPCYILIFHKIVFFDQKVCHDLNPTPYLQGQGYRVHIPKSMSGSQLLTDKLDMVIFHTIVVQTNGMSLLLCWIWAKGRIFKVKLQT